MIALVSSELYRAATIRSSRVSIVVFGVLGMLFGALNIDAWALLAGMGAFGLAVMIVAQHHQHRTAVLLYLARPRRALVLLGQVVTSVIVATGFAAISGVTVVARGEASRYQAILTVVPIIAGFAAANAAIVRRPTWLFLGYAGWFVFVEGLIGRFEVPLPFSSFLDAGAGDHGSLLVAAAWTVLAGVAAVIAVRRDLPSH